MIILLFIITSLYVFCLDTLVFSSTQGTPFRVAEKVIKEAYGKLGINIKVKNYPAERALHLSNGGSVDGELSRIKGMENRYQNLIRIPVPIFVFKGVAVTSGKELKIKDWSSLKPYKIGIRRGIKFAEIGTQGMDRYMFSENSNLFMALKEKDIDIAIISNVEAKKQMRELNLKGLKIISPPLVIKNSFHYLNKKNEHIVSAITNVLEDMSKSGRIKEIMDNYSD